MTQPQLRMAELDLRALALASIDSRAHLTSDATLVDLDQLEVGGVGTAGQRHDKMNA